MTPFLTSLIVFVFVLAGTAVGMLLSHRLPDHHLSADSKNVVGLATGMIATMAALILGLMTASAKSEFDAQDAAIKHLAVNLLELDRTLGEYGPETQATRETLRLAVTRQIATAWPEEEGKPEQLVAPGATPVAEILARQIVDLQPSTPAQTWAHSRALDLTSDLLQTRWTVFAAGDSSIPLPFLVVVVFWLAVIFASFGLFAPRNPTVLFFLVTCAMSVAASVFLILEMDRPFGGLMKISSAPLRYALAHLGQ